MEDKKASTTDMVWNKTLESSQKIVDLADEKVSFAKAFLNAGKRSQGRGGKGGKGGKGGA